VREYENSSSYFSEQLRIGSDMLYLYMAIDDQTDAESAPVVRELVDIMIDALNDPDKPRPEGEAILGRMVKESVIVFHMNALATGSLLSSSICRFCERAFKIATPNAARHFVESFTEYLETNVDHAQDRENDIVPPLEGYLEMRRPNVGGRSLFFIGEMGFNIPDEAYYHSVIRELQDLTADLLTLDNVSNHSIRPVTRARVVYFPASFRTWCRTTLNRRSARFVGIF